MTAALIERPWHPVSFFLDCLIPDVFYWKAKAENYLRNSGLNYAVIRPTQLVGEFDDEALTKYEVAQGDKIIGKISRFTLAETVFDATTSNSIPSKVTFECTGTTLEGRDRM